MRTFLVLICSLALAFGASGAEKKKKETRSAPQKRAASAQVSRPAAKPATVRKPAQVQRVTKPSKPTTTGRQAQVQRVTKPSKPTTTGRQAQVQRATKPSKPTTTGRQAQVQRVTKPGKPATAEAGRAAVARNAAAKPFKARRFNLATNTRPTKFAAVNFQQGRRIQGSQNWHGRNYWAFRNYNPVWHDRVWWRRNYNQIVFVYGGWYYWNSGWWYPAWGYDPGAYYAWDGPIYAYNGLPPDQVVANVQAALQEQGYYYGDVDGLLGPLTREALADYQRDYGLYMTSAVDRPTLESLGMA
jgi:Putative peptidoglycan binding domain